MWKHERTFWSDLSELSRWHLVGTPKFCASETEVLCSFRSSTVQVVLEVLILKSWIPQMFDKFWNVWFSSPGFCRVDFTVDSHQVNGLKQLPPPWPPLYSCYFLDFCIGARLFKFWVLQPFSQPADWLLTHCEWHSWRFHNKSALSLATRKPFNVGNVWYCMCFLFWR